MPLPEPYVEHLVTALLAVNNFPLDKAGGVAAALRTRGLLDPVRVGGMKQPEVETSLVEAGYDRGGYVPVLSFRLFPLMEAIALGQLDGLGAHVRKGEREDFVAELSKVHGFGPRTSDTAWLLWSATLSS